MENIKQEIVSGICPYCNEEYETKWYKTHKKCSECGMPFRLIEEKEKKEDEIKKYNKQIKKEFNQQKGNGTVEKKHYKKVSEENYNETHNNAESVTLPQNISVEDDYKNSDENSYLEDIDVQYEDNPQKKSIFEDDDYEDVEILDEDETLINNKSDTQQLQESSSENNNKKEKIDLKKILKKILSSENKGEELEVEKNIFNSNEDGFYDDAIPVVNPQEDHIKKSTIIKLVSIVVLLFLLTIFMIYYA